MQVSRYASKILHVCCEIFATFFYGSVTLVRSMLQTFSRAVEVGISLTPSWFLHPCLTYGPWVWTVRAGTKDLHIHSNNGLGDMFPLLSRSKIRRDFFKWTLYHCSTAVRIFVDPIHLILCFSHICMPSRKNLHFCCGKDGCAMNSLQAPKLDQLLIRGSHVALCVLGFVAQIWERKEKEGLMSLMDHDSNTGLCIITVHYI